jgi:hypothetical protein
MSTIFGTNGSDFIAGTPDDDVVNGWAEGSSEGDDGLADFRLELVGLHTLTAGGAGSDFLL